MPGARADGNLVGDAVRLGVDGSHRVPFQGDAAPRPSLAESEDRDRHGRRHDAGEHGDQDGASPDLPRLRDFLCLQWWELGLEPFDVELEEALGTVDVLEPVGAELAHRHASDLILDQLAGCVRQHDLTAVCHGSDSGRPMDAETHVSLIPDHGLARVQTHTHPHLAALGPPVLRERTLRHDCGSQRRIGTPKGEEEGVSLGVDLPAAALLRCCADDPLVLGENLAVALPEVLEQPRRSLDVGEEEGDCAARELGHAEGVCAGCRLVKLTSVRESG